MKIHPFKVKKDKDAATIEFKIDLPDGPEDKELVLKRYGSEKRVYEVANRQLIVDVATGIRKRLPDKALAETYVAGYRDDGSKDTFRPRITKEQQKEQKYTPAQRKLLESIGVQFE